MPLTRRSGAKRPEEPARIGFRPLYRQVRERLLLRLGEGTWPGGAMLPSEQMLAGELGVSQGTVRKALDALVAENLLVRRQGRGTFVALHDERRILFQFFRLISDSGARHFPESRMLGVSVAKASGEERTRLGLPVRARVVRMSRVRMLSGRPCIAESIALPDALFPGLAERELPNNLYGLYADKYGIGIARASERLKAIALTPADAALLGVASGTPALLIDRVAFAIDGRKVEWRVSRCLTRHVHYASDLT